MEQARKRAAKIKYVKVDDVTSAQLIAADADTKLFQRKIVPTNCIRKPTVSSLLSYQIDHCPQQPHNKFLEYAKFDGTAQTGSVLFKVYLTMIPQRKNYPMPICVSSTAKIEEFIGFICYKCSISIPNSEEQLGNFENFGLFIAEENGEIELGFPPLDKTEVCSRFCFTFLSLVECKPVSEQAFDPCPSLTSEAENAGQTLLTEMKNQQLEDVVLLSGHITDIEAPLYKIYRVYIVSKAVPIFRSSVQLGE
jgi:target of rapamycin complex 2 subunit MAPKAP1